jgi:hypothetical protein
MLSLNSLVEDGYKAIIERKTNTKMLQGGKLATMKIKNSV